MTGLLSHTGTYLPGTPTVPLTGVPGLQHRLRAPYPHHGTRPSEVHLDSGEIAVWLTAHWGPRFAPSFPPAG